MTNGVHASSEEANVFELNNVLRDGVQSNQGTNLSADEIIDMVMHTTDAEYAEYQIAGGTFMDLFLKKGRDAFGENTKLFDAFENVITSALIRGDCLTGYERNPQDVIDAVIEELADRGLNVVTNFHGNNFAPMQEGVFKAVIKAQENGHDIKAPKVVCIEDNPNITIEGIMLALAEQHDMGAAEGIYLKNASGKVDPDFVYELTKRVAAEYPGQRITLHTHDNHGMADAIYMRGCEAGAEMNATIALDVLPGPMASGTAQPPAWRIAKLLANHPSEKVQARAPKYDESKDALDAKKQYETRNLYGACEVRYSKESWDACYRAGMAGGAMAAIKGMGILDNVMGPYGLDEDGALAVVADIEADVKVLFGYPTSVTPFQMTMDKQAGLEAMFRKTKADYVPFSHLGPSSVTYLSGGLGPVSQTASPKLVEMALKERGLDNIETFIPADELPPGMEDAKKLLTEAGYENPTQSDVALTAMFGQAAFDEVMIRSGQSNDATHCNSEPFLVTAALASFVEKAPGAVLEQPTTRKTPSPQQPPQLPSYLQKPSDDHMFSKDSRYVTEYDVAIALGGAAELERFALAVTELEKHADGFYKTGIGPSGFFQRSPEGQSLTRKFSQENGDVRADISYLNEVHKDARSRAEADVANFMESIPTRLKEYGMPQKHAAAACFNHVPTLLAKVVDVKAKDASKRSLPNMPSGGVLKAYSEDSDLNGQEKPEGNAAPRLMGRASGQSNPENWMQPKPAEAPENTSIDDGPLMA